MWGPLGTTFTEYSCLLRWVVRLPGISKCYSGCEGVSWASSCSALGAIYNVYIYIDLLDPQ